MQPTPTNQPEDRRVQTKTVSPCTHSRVVDEVRSTQGAKTGRLVCLECMVEFPDPLYQDPGN
jgi:hypothetical protein